ncbi:hypothetical protein EAI_07028 [Harpegnathos saltator]|uniref:Uncharacterized protein n=1 Tax=Harpegnathos saltator TaxID=610380 RepID=E2C8W3_HARSA|nr:hypothetical protein EAI_07028 [Harpegnathos saltator]
MKSRTAQVPDLHTCPRSELQRCLPQSLESMKPYLAQGVPLLSIPAFVPYYIQLNKMIFTNDFIPMIKFRDTFISDISKFRISKVRVTDRNDFIQFLAHFSLVRVSTTFNAFSSFVRMLTKSSTYELNSILADVVAEITIRGSNFGIEIESEQYFYVHNVTVRIRKIRDVKTEKQEKGNPKYLMQLTNDYLEVEWDTLTSELIHNIQNIAAEIIQTISNKIYTSFPIHTLMTR